MGLRQIFIATLLTMSILFVTFVFAVGLNTLLQGEFP